MTKASKLTQILKDLEASSDVHGAAIVTAKGQMVASGLHSDVNSKAVGAMAAALLSIGNRVGSVLKTGETTGLMVNGTNSLVLLRKLKKVVLLALAPTEANLGLIDMEMDGACSEIEAHM